MSGAGPAPRAVDLHAHSTASDGELSPTRLVDDAARAGLAAIALTDHDTIAGIGEAQAAADRVGIRLVVGTELSAREGNAEIHLLALHLSRPDALESSLAGFRDARVVRADRIVERLNALGVAITRDAVAAEAGDAAVGRPHIARALVRAGLAADVRVAFDRWLGAGRPAFVEKQILTLGDAIGLAHEGGGLAILAHPGSEGTRRHIESIAALGLDGVEVRHPGHSSEDCARLLALAREFDLVPSGGSDFHGTLDPSRRLGCMQVPAAWLEEQDARVRERAGAAAR
ncbi:MAG TPA: PHP domain-containing protein [Gemmatimonadaceae bacterium]|nr:PHP domain-containing protein [Gemmatimonadaceae bacterium]